MIVGHLSTFAPTSCGIAHYAGALIDNLPNDTHLRFRLLHKGERADGSKAAAFALRSRSALLQAAAAINRAGPDVVSLQHEFGIYGGGHGRHVLALMDRIQKPIVTTFHSVLSAPSPKVRRIVRAILDAGSATIVLNDAARSDLIGAYDADGARIRVIRHGLPEVAFVPPSAALRRRAFGDAPLLMSAGYVTPSKGFEVTLRALARLKAEGHAFRFVILGSVQPQLPIARTYWNSVRQLAETLGLAGWVSFVEGPVADTELLEYLKACDLYIASYMAMDQASSGMVPFALACGRPVMATPFAYAREAADHFTGLFLAASSSEDDLLAALRERLQRYDETMAAMPAIAESARRWLWPNAAAHYREAFQAASVRPQKDIKRIFLRPAFGWG